MQPKWAARLHAQGIPAPNSLQADALPSIFAGQHVVLTAETGAGKTLCYLPRCLDALEAWVADYELAAAAATSESGATFPSSIAALVLVPTMELALQVKHVACALAPELSHAVRDVWGSRGVGRRDAVGMIIATPKALRENVNIRQLGSGLRVAVFDEADMLLSGAYLDDVRGLVLATFKQRMPADRPQHVFVAATLPATGTDSVAAFLNEFYPEEDGVVRIRSRGVHQTPAHVVPTFIQIDASLPRSAGERAGEARVERKAERSRTRQATAAAAAAAAADGFSNDAADVMHQQRPRDSLAARMDARYAEDEAGALAVDAAEHGERVEALRRHAVLEALISGGGRRYATVAADVEPQQRQRQQRGDMSRAAAPAAASTGAPIAQQQHEPLSPRRRRKHSSGMSELELISSAAAARLSSYPQGGAAQQQRHPRVSSSSVATAAAAAADDVSIISNDDDASSPIFEMRMPPQLRTHLTPAECARIPPTLIFVNSARGAESLRKFLIGAMRPSSSSLASRSGGSSSNSSVAPSRGSSGGRWDDEDAGSGSAAAATASTSPASPPTPTATARVTALHKFVDAEERAARVAAFCAGGPGAPLILVATNLAARGLDTTNVRHVIQAEFAQDAIAHLHRCGRTGRAGRPGSVTCLLTRDNLGLVSALRAAAEDGRSCEMAFSRRRSFRRQTLREEVRESLRASTEKGLLLA